MCKIVYDCDAPTSPFYKGSGEDYFVQEESMQMPVQALRTSTLIKNSKPVDRYFATLKPYYRVSDDNDDTLVFESRFESGNLKRAV